MDLKHRNQNIPCPRIIGVGQAQWDQSPAALPALPMSPSATTPKPCRDGDCWAAWTDEHSLIPCCPPALYDFFQSHSAHVPGTTMLIHFPLPTTLALFFPGKTRLLYPASQLYFISLFTISVIPFVMPGVLLLPEKSGEQLRTLLSLLWSMAGLAHRSHGYRTETGERSRSWGVRGDLTSNRNSNSWESPWGAIQPSLHGTLSSGGRSHPRDRSKAGAAELGSPSLQGILSHSLLLPLELPSAPSAAAVQLPCTGVSPNSSFPEFFCFI